jgi:hypothetical protein
MSGLPDMPGWCRGLSVEALQYVELSHVLHVLFFHELKSFHDLGFCRKPSVLTAGGTTDLAALKYLRGVGWPYGSLVPYSGSSRAGGCLVVARRVNR